MTGIQNLSPKLLREIFLYLSFAEISQLRGVSRYLHQAARKHLNSTFLELGPRLITKYTQYLLLLKTGTPSCMSGDAIFRGRFLRLLGSEHAILLALCRNYITNGKGCFSPGEILDLFLELLQNHRSNEMQQEENKNLARLVLLIDQYLDWFEKFRMSSEEHCSWYGTCVVDLLDSYLSASYNLVATHDGPLVKLSGSYVAKGQCEIPPKIGEALGGSITSQELLQVLRYIRKHVRWSNFIKSFRNESEKIAEFEEDNEEIITNNKQEGYQRSYKRNEWSFRDYDGNAESLIVMVNLQCDRCYGPARLRDAGFEEINEWRNKIEVSKRDMKFRHFPLQQDLSIISKSHSRMSFKPKRIKSRFIKEPDRTDTSKAPLRDKYLFNLEIKSIYPRTSSANSGEKFNETMLHVSHTPQHIFAAQTECSLY